MNAKKMISIIAIIAINGQAFFSLVPASQAKTQDTQKQSRDRNTIKKEARIRMADAIKGNQEFSGSDIDWGSGDATLPKSISKINRRSSDDKEKDVQDLISKLNSAFKIKDIKNDIRLNKILKDKKTKSTHSRLSQFHKGIRVFGGEVTMHEDRDGNIRSLVTDLVPDINISITPKITKEDAIIAAKSSLNGIGDIKITKEPELVIYSEDNNPILAYNLELSSNKRVWNLMIDSKGGSVIFKIDNIRDISGPTSDGSNVQITGNMLSNEGGRAVNLDGWRENSNSGYYLFDKNRKYQTYNLGAIGSYPDAGTYAHRVGISSWGNSDTAEISASKNVETTLDFFKNRFGFGVTQLYSDETAILPVNVHVDDGYGNYDFCNAYWDSYSINFGDGNGADCKNTATIDIIGHELAHGWTERTSDLIYMDEPGALNESFSDIMGTNIEFQSQDDGTDVYPNAIAGKADWLLGEDTVTGGFRDMKNPARLGQPTRYRGNNWEFTSADYGGVHQNSGVQNYFYYLFVNGGAGNNEGIGFDIPGSISLSDAGDIAYMTNAYFLGRTSEYVDARIAWKQAADIYDPSGLMGARVDQAWDAVGVYTYQFEDYFDVVDQRFEDLDARPAGISNSGALWLPDADGALDAGSVYSGDIGDYQSTEMIWEGTTATGYLSYWYKTSTEYGYDKLKLFIDGELFAFASGERSWNREKVVIPGGYHTIRWIYSKDESESHGQDKVWIDDITFPISPSGSINVMSDETMINIMSEEAGIMSDEVDLDDIFEVKPAPGLYANKSLIPIGITSNRRPVSYMISSPDISGVYADDLGYSYTGSTVVMMNEGDGLKTIYNTFTDMFGNVGSTSASFFIDNTGPSLPQLQGIDDGDIFRSRSLSFSWSKSTDGGVGMKNGKYHYEILDSDDSTVIGSGITSSTGTDFEFGNDGMYDIRVAGMDSLGNRSGYAGKNIIIDTNAPTATGTFLSGAFTSSLTPRLRLDSSEAINYVITSSGALYSTGYSAGSSDIQLFLTGADGLKDFKIDFTDIGGQTGSTAASITIDTQAPEYILNIYDSMQVTGGSFVLTGTTDDIYSGIGTITVNGSSLIGSLIDWSTTLSLMGGDNLIDISFSDNLGNTVSTGITLFRKSITNPIGANIAGINSANISFTTDVASIGGVMYGTSAGDMSAIANGTNGLMHTITLSELIPESTYFYRTFGKNSSITGSLSEIRSFTLPKVISSSAGTQISTGAVALSGATSSGISYAPDLGDIVIISNDGLNSLRLSLSGMTITSSGIWDGIIQAPENALSGADLSGTGFVVTGGVYQAGNPSAGLALSGQTALMSIFVGTGLDTKTLNVHRSEDGLSYINIGSCLVSAGNCVFTTDHFSYFAFSLPTDAQPDTFAFNAIVGVELSAEITSESIIVSGINTESPISITNGTYSINGGSFTGVPGLVHDNDIIRARLISSASNSASVSATISIGGVDGIFKVDTKARASSGGGGGGGGGGMIYTTGVSAPATANSSRKKNLPSKSKSNLTILDSASNKKMIALTDAFKKYVDIKTNKSKNKDYIKRAWYSAVIRILKAKIVKTDDRNKQLIIFYTIKNLEKEKNALALTK